MQSRWAEDVSLRVRKVAALLKFALLGEPTLCCPPPVSDLDATRRASVSGYSADAEDTEPVHWGCVQAAHRYDDLFTKRRADLLVRGAIWSILFCYRPERKFLRLAHRVWWESPEETSFERALLRFRLKQLEAKITDHGEYTVWEVARQMPAAVWRVLASEDR